MGFTVKLPPSKRLSQEIKEAERTLATTACVCVSLWMISGEREREKVNET
jgi:hypothetical protein